MDSVRCRTAERFPTRKQSFRFPGVSGTSTEKSITINHSIYAVWDSRVGCASSPPLHIRIEGRNSNWPKEAKTRKSIRLCPQTGCTSAAMSTWWTWTLTTVPSKAVSDLPSLSRTMTAIFIPMFFWSFRWQHRSKNGICRHTLFCTTAFWVHHLWRFAKARAPQINPEC